MKVMIVDDDKPYRSVLRMALERRGGYEVIETASGKECFEKLESEKPDLVLVDIMMPGMDGWEVCKKIKEGDSTQDTKVVILSVRKRGDDKFKSITYSNADMYMEKGVGFDAILKTVDAMLEVASAEKAREG